MVTVIVRFGVIDVPDPSAFGEQRRLARIDAAAGHSYWHMRRYGVGEVVDLPDGEAKRLAAAGIVSLVSSP
jgi:hypothetical protein